MNSAVSVIDHPNDETLAAFVDGRLDAAAREDVMKHAADCTDCRDVVLLATEIAAEEGGANVVRPRVWPRVVAPLAAAAALGVVFLGTPQVRERVGVGPMGRAAKLARTLDERPSEARLSFDVGYKPAKTLYRGGEGGKIGDPSTEWRAAEATALANEKPTVANLRAAGVMLMLAAKRAEAVTYLQRAVEAADPPSAALLKDLTAAYLANGDNAEALATAEAVWRIEQTPIAAWNRALALERLGTDIAAAKAAWETYLKMDPNSPWADEVRDKHLPQLQ